MKLLPAPARRTRSARLMSIPVAMAWTHCGTACRVTPWPGVAFERRYGDEWVAFDPSEEVLASGAASLTDADWGPFLDFLPAPARELLLRFKIRRLETLLVLARCPALADILAETPSLSAFLAGHASLRGTTGNGWDEISATFERSGIFGLLTWLGLPASRQTLAVLNNLSAPDLSRRLLESFRSLLWEPRALFVLQRLPVITEAQLARFPHALAA